MDIKLKKSKAAVSFICMMLSAAIFLSTAVAGTIAAVRYTDVRRQYQDLKETDYQNTASFRTVMSGYLSNILDSIAQEEELENANDFAQKQAKEHGYDTAEEFVQDKGFDSVESWIGQQHLNTKFEDLNQHDTAKNVLFQAGTKNNPAQYTNYSDVRNLYNGFLPKGYNFRLIYDGEKVTADKDGKPVDIYGNGFFKSNENMWNVPGYENLPYIADSDYRVCLVARAVPAEPVGGYSQLYNLTHKYDKAKLIFWIWVGVMAAALVMLIPAFGWRNHRKLATQRLGLLTGKVFFEIKLLCSIALLVLDIASINSSGKIIVVFGGFSLICWYLVLNDIRWNPRFWDNNIVNYGKQKRYQEECTLPVQKRLVNRLNRLYKREAAIFVVGGFLSVVLGLWAFILGPITLAVMWYYAREYKKEYEYVTGDLGRLILQIAAVKEGNMEAPLVFPLDADMHDAAKNLNQIRAGVESAVEERLKSERMKIELITNVSHDIKTPLTSIISYVNLLKQEDDLPDYVKDYVHILDEKSNRLKNMVQDIFEVSKASSGNMEMKMEQLDLGKLLRQTLADMEEQVEASTLIFKEEIPLEPVYINADGSRLYRVFQNLINNAVLYSMEGTRVFITLSCEADVAVAMVKNISKYELNNPEELTERFVRGDSARTACGSGLGLSIAKSFTEACGGLFSIRLDADLFTACVEFPMLADSAILQENTEEILAVQPVAEESPDISEPKAEEPEQGKEEE